MHQQVELVGPRAAAGRTVGGEVALMGLDQVLSIAARTIDVLVEMRGRACEVGDDEAAVAALGPGLDAGDDTAGSGILPCWPGLGRIVDLAVAPHLHRLAFGPAVGHVFAEVTHAAEQHPVAGQPKDVADAGAFAEHHRLDAPVVAVSAHGDTHPRPARTDAAHDMAQHARHLGAVGRPAGAQEDGDGFAGRCLIYVDRQEATAVVVGIELGQLLAAMRLVLGVVDVEHDVLGLLDEAVAEDVDHGGHHARQRSLAGQVLQPCHGRLRA